MTDTYKIVRGYRDKDDRETIATGLTRTAVQKHCRNKESSSVTCTSEEGKQRTANHGPWFDRWEKEDDEDDELRHEGIECVHCGEVIEDEADGDSTPHGSMHKGCAEEHEQQHPEQW